MTRRDDLEKTIKDLQKALHEAQEELDNLNKFERFVPKRNERYYIVNGFCTIDLIENNMTPFDNNCINCYNCFLGLKNKVTIRIIYLILLNSDVS